jgi:hypothetical protein
LNGEGGRCAEAEEADPLARLRTRDAQAAEADDSSTEQRREELGIDGRGQGEGEVGAYEGIFGVTTVDRIAGEGG